ncbi:MAG: exosortase-associated EpsI family protein, partial [Pseudomonadales bacterium]|nr:exosortase-associated EpsI family protein [Pseudomonadales bacterium]
AVHDALGWLLVVAVGAVPFLLLGERRQRARGVDGHARPTNRALAPHLVGAVGAIALLLAPGLLPAWLPDDRARAAEQLEHRLDALPWRLGTWVGARRQLPPRELEILDADAVVHRAYVDLDSGEELLLVAAWHRELAHATGHGARKCYRARGWTLDDATVLAGSPAGERTERFLFRRAGVHITVFETVFDVPTGAGARSREGGRLRVLLVLEGTREDTESRRLAAHFTRALVPGTTRETGGLD